jgi:hypothetical protein
MNSKLHGKLEASGRAGLRDIETRDLIAVYPYKVTGTDEEIEEKVKYWFYQRDCSAEERLNRYFVDTLGPMEIKNSKEKFLD